ncbi:hypothetical protein P8Q88_11490 [Qipengyuania sp. XHP0207]|uniref:hypothetical protein n=1 Tax=Qipengyuania sp. XHP0207 TaxID=3038078 RepID=UPI00241E32C1|nr:hypothetical protein [Qipengyuania sp. XHP0207]MDG5748797.1 hypothetical protein [Qipengyuania sp. XHP0207]
MERLDFHSKLAAGADQVWSTLVRMSGIEQEMRPLLRMTSPSTIDDLREISLTDGRPLFTSTLLAFGVVPIGRTKLRLCEILENASDGHYRFVENSEMTGMQSWRHVREVRRAPRGCLISDWLAFEPIAAPGVVKLAVGWFFRHRHHRLKEMFG